MYIKRKIEDDIFRYLNRPEILAIIGPRQCGKTTVLKHVYDRIEGRKIWLNFEDLEVLKYFENDIKGFGKTYAEKNKYIFIDEFQYAKGGGRLLKYIYDTYRAKIIISGSSAVDLTLEAVKYLVGRVFILNMYQFDFDEFLRFRDIKLGKEYRRLRIDLKNPQASKINPADQKKLAELFAEYAVWGGYPQVVLSKSETDKREVIKNIYNTYFLRDVKSILGLIDDYKLNNLIKLLALQIGNMADYSDLAQASGQTFLTAKKYLNFLSKTFICDFSPPFFSNKRKEIVKNKKVFFFDCGLRNQAINDFRPLTARPDRGALLENAIWAQLIKRGYNPHFWRDKNKNEIDFIIDIGEGRIAAAEAKLRSDKCLGFPAIFNKTYPNSQSLYFYLYKEKKAPKNDCFFAPLL